MLHSRYRYNIHYHNILNIKSIFKNIEQVSAIININRHMAIHFKYIYKVTY